MQYGGNIWTFLIQSVEVIAYIHLIVYTRHSDHLLIRVHMIVCLVWVIGKCLLLFLVLASRLVRSIIFFRDCFILRKNFRPLKLLVNASLASGVLQRVGLFSREDSFRGLLCQIGMALGKGVHTDIKLGDSGLKVIKSASLEIHQHRNLLGQVVHLFFELKFNFLNNFLRDVFLKYFKFL